MHIRQVFLVWVLWGIFVIACFIKIVMRDSAVVGRPTHYQLQISDGRVDETQGPTPVKILLWTPYFGFRRIETKFLLRLMGIKNMRCSTWCHLTQDQGQLNDTDVLVWHGWRRDMMETKKPPYRNPNQPWVYWYRETPQVSSPHLGLFNGVFNWTMTYRLDSDIIYSYGRTVPLTFNQNNTVEEEWLQQDITPISGRSKLAVSVISNCKTTGKRDILIRSLRKHGLSVDIYGKCGIKVKEPPSVFWSRLQKTYKFYLAFENALCTDYITEKLWRSLKLGMVPVVYGAGNYTQVAPPHSFINSREFNSTKQLVEYLKVLDRNDTAYAQYMEWRKLYRVEDDGEGFCFLCEKIRDWRLSQGKSGVVITPTPLTYKPYSHHVYYSLKNWWRNLNQSDSNETMLACKA